MSGRRVSALVVVTALVVALVPLAGGVAGAVGGNTHAIRIEGMMPYFRGGFSGIAALSADGRFVAFSSGDQILLRDRETGVMEVVSVTSDGADGNGYSYYPSLSDDTRFVAFASQATNLVPGVNVTTSGGLYVHDRVSGDTELISVIPDGTSSRAASSPAISGNGRFVVFWSNASDLVTGDNDSEDDVFIRDRVTGVTELVSVPPTGASSDLIQARRPAVSSDGRFVAFVAYERVQTLGTGMQNVFVRDRLTGVTERAVDVKTAGYYQVTDPSISADGRYVAFTSDSPDVGGPCAGGDMDVFVLDRSTDAVECISQAVNGAPGNSISTSPAISADGSHVAFGSWASDLVLGDTNPADDVFVRDLDTGETLLVSVMQDGSPADGRSPGFPQISADGKTILFTSWVGLSPDDTNGSRDGYIADVLLISKVSRLAGANRFASAVAVSQEMYPGGADRVYVATGYNFPDALAAGGGLPGPVLLTNTDSLPGIIASEIQRLNPSEVFVIGGTAAVSDAVLLQIENSL